MCQPLMPDTLIYIDDCIALYLWADCQVSNKTPQKFLRPSILNNLLELRVYICGRKLELSRISIKIVYFQARSIFQASHISVDRQNEGT